MRITKKFITFKKKRNKAQKYNRIYTIAEWHRAPPLHPRGKARSKTPLIQNNLKNHLAKIEEIDGRQDGKNNNGDNGANKTRGHFLDDYDTDDEDENGQDIISDVVIHKSCLFIRL